MKDPYQTLGVARGADAAALKRAYRKLAKKLHPDVNPGNAKIEQRFKEVSQAYGILGDAKKRAQFDRGEIDASGQQTGWGGGVGGARGGGWRGGGGRHRPFDFGADLNVEDIVSELFGAGGRGRARRGRQRPNRSAGPWRRSRHGRIARASWRRPGSRRPGTPP